MLAMVASLISAVAIQQAVLDCTPAVYDSPVTGETVLSAPDDTWTSLRLGLRTSEEGAVQFVRQPSATIAPEAGGGWKLGAYDPAVDQQTVLVWGTDAEVYCVQALPSVLTPPPTPTVTPPVTPPEVTPGEGPYLPSECKRAGSEWLQKLRLGSNATVIVVGLGGGICWRNRDYGVVGDPIHVAVFTDDNASWQASNIVFEPCSLEPGAPSIYVSGDLSDLSALTSRNLNRTFRRYGHLPRTCFNRTVSIDLTPSAGPAQIARIQLEQFNRYRAGVQVGVLFTELHSREFGLREVSQTSADGTTSSENVIFLRQLDGEGPRYFASLTIYSFLRYLGELGGSVPFPGRDIVHDQSLVDRLGLILGVGLSDPGEEFIGGFGLEVVRGLSVTGTWYFKQVDELSGISLGDVFDGEEDDIPITRTWKSDFELGLSIDIRYITALFQSGGS